MEAQPQIAVNPNSLPTTVITVLRYVLNAIGALLITNEILPGGTDVNAIVGSILLVVSTGYGAYKSWKHNEQKKEMEPYVPNDVAALTTTIKK